MDFEPANELEAAMLRAQLDPGQAAVFWKRLTTGDLWLNDPAAVLDPRLSHLQRSQRMSLTVNAVGEQFVRVYSDPSRIPGAVLRADGPAATDAIAIDRAVVFRDFGIHLNPYGPLGAALNAISLRAAVAGSDSQPVQWVVGLGEVPLVPSMTAWVRRKLGRAVNRKRVAPDQLYGVAGIVLATTHSCPYERWDRNWLLVNEVTEQLWYISDMEEIIGVFGGDAPAEAGRMCDTVVFGDDDYRSSLIQALNVVSTQRRAVVLHETASILCALLVRRVVDGFFESGADAVVPLVGGERWPAGEASRWITVGDLAEAGSVRQFPRVVSTKWLDRLRPALVEEAPDGDEITTLVRLGARVLAIPGEPRGYRITAPEQIPAAVALEEQLSDEY